MTEDHGDPPVFSDQTWTFDEKLLDPAGPTRGLLATDDPARLDSIRTELETGFRALTGVTKISEIDRRVLADWASNMP